MNISLKIATISLIFSLIALVWNIFRDIWVDRVKLNLRMFAGKEIIDDKQKTRVVSVGAEVRGLNFEEKITPEKVFFQITNIGRRDIEINSIKAEYADKQGWFLPIDEKRYLKPYESTNANTANSNLKLNLRNNKVVSIYVEDTTGKKWRFSSRDIRETSCAL